MIDATKLRLVDGLVALAVAIASVLIAAWFLGYGSAPLAIPSSYSGDALFYNMLIKGIVETGWYLDNPLLGAPFGLDMGPFPIVEGSHLALIAAIGHVVDDFGLTFTLFYLASFATVSISGYCVFRTIGVGVSLAAAGAILYSLLTFHFLRGGHLFLASYASVPVFVWMALRLYDTSNFRPRMVTVMAYSALTIIAVSSGVYYAFFGSILILFAAVTASIEKASWRPILVGAMTGVVVIAALWLNLVPHLDYLEAHPHEAALAEREPQEAENFGLKFIQLALPTKVHRNTYMSRIAETYGLKAPLVNENMTSSLGLLGLAGFLISIGAVLFRRRSIAPNMLSRIGGLNLVAFLFGTVGGVGALFSWVATPQFRGLNRISIVIAFLSLCALFWGASQLTARVGSVLQRRLLNASLAVAFLAVGLWDQIPANAARLAPTFQATYERDAKNGEAIMQVLNKGARVYQLPYVPFPESAPLYTEQVYGLSRRYLHTQGIAWSFGSMRLSPGDQWVRHAESLPLPERISTLAASGFDAILVERRAYKDAGMAVEGQIAEEIGEPALVCPDQSCALFLLNNETRESGAPLLLPALGGGFSNWMPGSSGRKYAKTTGSGESLIFLLNPTRRTVRARIRIVLSSENSVSIAARLEGVELKRLHLDAQESSGIDTIIDLPSGMSTLELGTTSAENTSSGSSPAGRAYQIDELLLGAVDEHGLLSRPGEWHFVSDTIFSNADAGQLATAHKPKGNARM